MDRRTIEVRSVNVKANNGSWCSQFDYAPGGGGGQGGEQRVEYGVPIEGRIVPTTFPSTEEGTVRTKLTLEARCGL